MQPILAPAPPPPHPLRAAPQHQNEHVPEQGPPGMRERLLASLHNSHVPNYQPRPESEPLHSPQSHNIDPAIASSGVMNQHPQHQRQQPQEQQQPPPQPHSGGEGSGDGDDKKGKRELSNSKRAAQNRAAQRAFRQRKECHIKTLETQVREMDNLNNSVKNLRAENSYLRDYISTLQSDLIQTKGHYPAPPPHTNLQGHPGNIVLASSVQDGGILRQIDGAEDRRDGRDGGEEGHAPTASMESAEQQLQASTVQGLAQHNREDGGRTGSSDKRPMMSPPNGLPAPPPS